MKPEATGSNAALYNSAADQQPLTTPSPQVSAQQVAVKREPSPDRRGQMAMQLRQAARGGSAAESAHPSPTVSVHSAELTLVQPTTLAAYRQEIQSIEQKAMQMLQQHQRAHRQLMQSWPAEMPYKTIQETFEQHWSETLDRAGYQALRTDALPPHEQAQANAAEEEMSERVSEHILAGFKEEGWIMNPTPAGLEWGMHSPLTLLKDCDFHSVQSSGGVKEASGEHGLVKFLTTPLRHEGLEEAPHAELVLKRPHGDGWDTASHEMEGYRKIIEEVGLHPNLAVPIGLARVNNDAGLMLRKIPGCTGDVFFGALQRAKENQTISPVEFEEVLALLLQRGLSVVDHCRGAAVCISDMKPANFILDEKTGEPVFYDLGLWSEENGVATGSTKRFSAPEALPEHGELVNHRSDMFGMVAILADAVGGGRPMYRHSPQGRVEVGPNLLESGVLDSTATVRHPADACETPLWQFAAGLMYKEVDGQRSMRKEDRTPIDEAQQQLSQLRSTGHEDAYLLGIVVRLVNDLKQDAASIAA